MVLIVQPDALPRIRALAALMGWHYKYARGTIDELWTNSQGSGEWKGTSEDIAFWAGEFELEDRGRLIAALSHNRVKFVSKIDGHDDLYEIRGNRSQIEDTKRRQEKARANARKRWAKEAARADRNASSITDSNPTSTPDSNADGNASSITDSNATSIPGSNAAAMLKPSQAKPSVCVKENTCVKESPALVHEGPAPPGPEPGDPGPESSVPPAEYAPRSISGATISALPKETRDALEKKLASPVVEDFDLRTSKRLLRTIRELHQEHGHAEKIAYADPERWASDIRLMRTSDGISERHIESTLEWAMMHGFWKFTVQSAEGFRRNYPEIRKQMAADSFK